MTTPVITPHRLEELRHRDGSVDLIDVRTPMEFRAAHAAPARNVPLHALDPHAVMQQRNGAGGEPLYVICQSGSRAAQARQAFLDAGYENVVSVEGGLQAWEESGLAVVYGKKAISLERQVRIVAGFIALVGAVLAMTVHPYFAGISAFIGAGLMFAGITDTCGMGLMLARMPWNQLGCAAETCETEGS